MQLDVFTIFPQNKIKDQLRTIKQIHHAPKKQLYYWCAISIMYDYKERLQQVKNLEIFW